MRVIAVHDNVGNIVSLLTGPSDAPPTGVRLEPGQEMREIDVSQLTLDSSDPELHARLTEIIETYKVQVPAQVADVPAARLIRREQR